MDYDHTMYFTENYLFYGIVMSPTHGAIVS